MLPDLLADQDNDVEGAVPVINATETPVKGLVLKVEYGEAKISGRTLVPVIPPLGTRKVGFRLTGKAPAVKGTLEATVTLLDKDDKDAKPFDTIKIKLRVVESGQTRKVTFRSDLDGSVQYYALVPAKRKHDDPKPGLVLTLHGAGVEGDRSGELLRRQAVDARRGADQPPAVRLRLGRLGPARRPGGP